MILLVDNYDSFTYNLSDYLQRCGAQIEVIKNDIAHEQWKTNNYQGLVLSPGPGTPDRSGRLMEIFAYFRSKLPILGICLGQQAIGMHFGATLKRAAMPMHGKISMINVDNSDLIFNHLPKQLHVVRYHSLILDSLPPHLKILAHTGQNEIMAIRHVNQPIWGLQFHPEAWCTEHGLTMLQNWVNFVYKK